MKTALREFREAVKIPRKYWTDLIDPLEVAANPRNLRKDVKSMEESIDPPSTLILAYIYPPGRFYGDKALCLPDKRLLLPRTVDHLHGVGQTSRTKAAKC